MVNSFYNSDIYKELTGNGKIISQGIIKLSVRHENRVFYLNQFRWAKKLGISRTTLNMVIKILKHNGVIEEIGHTYLNKKVYKWVYETNNSLDISPRFDDFASKNRFYQNIYHNAANYGLDGLASSFGVDISKEISLEEYYENYVDIDDLKNQENIGVSLNGLEINSACLQANTNVFEGENYFIINDCDDENIYFMPVNDFYIPDDFYPIRE